jgi:hypothetical protein
MARLIETVEDLKRHIVLSATFDFKKVLPYSKRAERKIVINLIGREQYEAIVADAFDPDSTEPKNLVRELLEEAVAHYALFLAMPTINILITNAGAQTSQPSDAKLADWKDRRDLNRSLIKTFTEALDDAFELMENHIDEFEFWEGSSHYTVFKDLIVSQTSIFNHWFPIQNNRQTFLGLKPLMREVEQQYLIGMLGDCTLDFLKGKSTNDIVILAQECAQRAIVSLTVAKAADTGTFLFTESAMVLSTDEMPWEKTVIGLSEEKLARLRKSRQLAGEQYLKDLKGIVSGNPSLFDCYQDKTETGISEKLIKKKSGLWL